MKLIDILVQELPKRGGWPEGVEEIWQDYDRLMRPIGWFHDELCDDHRRQHRDADVKINSKQYEAALAASKAEWNGNGLPPVGVNAEVFFSADTEPKWHSFLAKFIGENHVIALVGLEEISYKKDELLTSGVKFAPLRSEEARKHDEITQSILDILNDYDFELVHIRSDQKRIATDLVERITSGMIPHIRIE
ncbi:hypothetical protein [Klebsiella aerogenes]|uniref:hypothetical protein n=1 Tax=Klebsiella aerogenes TaxID=548 RepID=UPI0021B4034D|nr:hypothetical protein [Klebsiella aerogenes]